MALLRYYIITILRLFLHHIHNIVIVYNLYDNYLIIVYYVGRLICLVYALLSDSAKSFLRISALSLSLRLVNAFSAFSALDNPRLSAFNSS